MNCHPQSINSAFENFPIKFSKTLVTVYKTIKQQKCVNKYNNFGGLNSYQQL